MTTEIRHVEVTTMLNKIDQYFSFVFNIALLHEQTKLINFVWYKE